MERGYTALTGWEFSDRLAGGYGRPNRLRVEYDGEAGSFRALINGTEVEQVRNDGGIRLSGGGFGHLVSLSPHERFPEVAVHVEFRQITPVDIGLAPSPPALASTMAVTTSAAGSNARRFDYGRAQLIIPGSDRCSTR